MNIENMSNEERMARIEYLLAIAKGDVPPNRLDRIELLLERLTQRHEALAESIEIMVQEGTKLQRAVASHERRLSKLEGRKGDR